MSVEIICVGTELLLGETINTNASFISGKLADIGIDCYYQSTVGDNSSKIQEALGIALKRADIIIFTGGLGPTDDDITVQSIADFFNEELILDENSLRDIIDFFKSINKEMPKSNIKQACRPGQSEVIPNPKGTAPGFIWELEQMQYKGKVILTFPGVPSELESMWEQTASKYLSKYSEGVILTKFIKYFGIAEAVLAQEVSDLMESSNPTVAPLVGIAEPRLRIAAKAKSTKEAKKLIETMQVKVLSRTGEYCYGFDQDTMESVVGKLLIDNKLTVAVAESCTGGLISSRLTDVSGSSAYIKINYVTYSNDAKIKYLGVNENIIKNYGAVSDKTALSMAIGVRGFAKADIGLAISGIAGPTGGTEEKPVGLVYISVCDKYRQEVYEVRISPRLTRSEIKFRASQHALNYLRLFINKILGS